MKIFKVSVRAFGPKGYIPLKNLEYTVHASKARTAIHYVLTSLDKGVLKGRRADSFQINVSCLGIIPVVQKEKEKEESNATT